MNYELHGAVVIMATLVYTDTATRTERDTAFVSAVLLAQPAEI